MYPSTTSRTRSSSSTCTAARVSAILDLFLGDLAAFLARGLMTRDSAVGWLRDLTDILVLEAVQRFQVKITFPSGNQIALDYEVFDDGRISTSDGCGGFSSHWIPAGSTVSLVVRWRAGAPKLEEARRLLHERGWGTGTMLDATGAAERTFSKEGYGVNRRIVGEWSS